MIAQRKQALLDHDLAPRKPDRSQPGSVKWLESVLENVRLGRASSSWVQAVAAASNSPDRRRSSTVYCTECGFSTRNQGGGELDVEH